MPTYKRKPTEHEAVQWNTHGDSDKVVRSGERGVTFDLGARCSRCGKTSEAHGHLKTVYGGQVICPGTWIVRGVNATKLYNDNDFQERFEVV